MRTGMEAVAGFPRKVSQTANPSNSGIITSMMIKSGDTVWAFLSASMPLVAVPMANPAFFKVNRITSS